MKIGLKQETRIKRFKSQISFFVFLVPPKKKHTSYFFVKPVANLKLMYQSKHRIELMDRGHLKIAFKSKMFDLKH